MKQGIRLLVNHEVGLHARPAAVFVQAAVRYKSDIRVENINTGKGPVNAKSILSVLSLGVSKGQEILISADGPDASTALKALKDLVNSNFGENIT